MISALRERLRVLLMPKTRRQPEHSDPGVTAYHLYNREGCFIIDAQTAKDLDLSAFSEKYDRTSTAFGEQVFYHRLHSQPNDPDECRREAAAVRDLAEDADRLAYLTRHLKKLGRQHRGNVVRDLWNGLPYRPVFMRLIPWWFFLAPSAAVAVFLFSSTAGFILTSAVLLVNLVLFILTNAGIAACSGSLHYLIRGLAFIRRMERHSAQSGMSGERRRLNGIERVRKYGWLFKDGFAGAGSQDPVSLLIDYLRVFLCAELFAFYCVSVQVETRRAAVRRIIALIGRLDCRVNSALLLRRNTAVCTPVFSDRRAMEFAGLVHPLVTACVDQELDIRRGMIITGMNMAGKSTFLRSVAINQLLATGLGFCFARRFETGFFRVVSSMKIEDDVKGRRSKYYVEAERLLQIQRMLKSDALLCLIDEVLAGTNTEDRIAASLGLLRNCLNYPNSLVLAATHDNPIAEAMQGAFDCYFFDGDIDGDEILYDYRIKPGIVSRRNAILLLHRLGLELDNVIQE